MLLAKLVLPSKMKLLTFPVTATDDLKTELLSQVGGPIHTGVEKAFTDGTAAIMYDAAIQKDVTAGKVRLIVSTPDIGDVELSVSNNLINN